MMDDEVRLYRGFNSERLAWAQDAYQAFLELLPEDIRPNFVDDRSEVTAAVYGNSQVGKTTIILQLLGMVADPNLGPYRVLRGGRELGTSATATAMRYRVSTDDTWVWESEGVSQAFACDDEESVIARVRELRERVESGEQTRHTDVRLSIPSKFVTAPSDFSVSIIDLPGIEAKNSNERQHAIDLANHYLPIADAVVLVGTIEALTFLAPRSIDIDLLQRWWAIQDRTKIVTTRTYSDNTVRQLISEAAVDEERLRDYLVEQIQSHDLPKSIRWDQVRQNVYPIECGDSWNALVGQQNAYARIAQRMNERFMSDLHRDLERNASIEARISTAYKARAIYEDVMNAKLEAKRDERSRLEERLLEKTGEMTRSVKNREQFLAEVIRLTEKCQDLKQARSHTPSAALSQSELDARLRMESNDPGKAKQLRTKARDTFNEAIRRHRKVWTEWAQNVPDLQGVEKQLSEFHRTALASSKKSHDKVVHAWGPKEVHTPWGRVSIPFNDKYGSKKKATARAHEGVAKIDKLAAELLRYPLVKRSGELLDSCERDLEAMGSRLRLADEAIATAEAGIGAIKAEIAKAQLEEMALHDQKREASALVGAFDRELRTRLAASLNSINEDWQTGEQSSEEGLRLGLQALGNLFTLERIEGHQI